MQKRPKSLIFIPFLAPGGAEKQGILLAEYLFKRGHDVTVWGFESKQSQEIERRLHDAGIKTGVVSMWPPYPVFTMPVDTFAGQLAALAREFRYRSSYKGALPPGQFDFAIPFTPWPGVVCSLFQRELGKPLTMWNHRGGDDDGGFQYNPGLVKRIERVTAAFVANSKAGRDFLLRQFPGARDRVSFIPNIYGEHVATSENAQRKVEELGDPIRLTHIANAFTEKDIPTAIRGVQLLMERGHKVKLTLVGGYPYKDIERQITKLIREERLDPIIERLGPLDQNRTQTLLSVTDIGLLSSRSEGTPNVIMEFMAHGIPVVATRIPGIQGLVGTKNQEFLFAPGDSQGLCDAVTALVSDRNIREELVLENLERLRVDHSMENVGSRWLEVLGSRA